MDADGKITDANNIDTLPTSYFINKNGEAVGKRVGQMTLDQMKAEIEKLSDTSKI